MRPETISLFPNFAREIQKLQKEVRNNLTANTAEEPEVPDVYKNYFTHVNIINAFKEEMANTTLADEVAKIVPAGETLVVTRECLSAINMTWNKWVNCYDALQNANEKLATELDNVGTGVSDAIESLKTLIKDKDNKYAKDELDDATCFIQKHLRRGITATTGSMQKITDFCNGYDSQKENFVKIIDALGKEATLQGEERDKITARIKQLRDDISSYNASIAALAISMGVSVTIITGSFVIAGGFGIVITLFLLPAVAVAIAKLVEITAKIKKAKAEIASYGDYENEYNAVISKLNELKTNVEDFKDKSEAVKKELDGVIAPWNALEEDIEAIKKAVPESTSEEYDKMKSAFEGIQEGLSTLTEYLKYLDCNKKTSKVVQVDNLDPTPDSIQERAKEEGVSMDDFMAA